MNTNIPSIRKQPGNGFSAYPVLSTWLPVVSEWVLTSFLRVEMKRFLNIKPAHERKPPPPKPGRQYVLYLHVPFCESLCPYCSFNRFIFNETVARNYFISLREEINQTANLGYRFETMYIGGGTPTILPDELIRTIDLAKELFPIREVSCETNPNHLTSPVIELLKGRVQRLSVGVQSFNNQLLAQMQRCEKFGSAEEIQERIRTFAPEFTSLNVDMIFNFSNQTEAILREDIRQAIGSGAQQVTYYPLMTSPTVSRSLASSVGRVDYRRERKFFEIIHEEMEKEFTASTAWTFQRNGAGMIDEYIVNTREYVGLGSGAFSYLDGTLFVNTFSLSEYKKLISARKMSVTGVQKYSRYAQMRYNLMMDLFGLDMAEDGFPGEFGISRKRGLWLEMFLLNMVRAFEKDTNQLTPLGQYLSLVIMREFFSGVNLLRDTARSSISPEGV
jgi:coproporphyrinogen III oxidase-like Fe-S oxidoreductase